MHHHPAKVGGRAGIAAAGRVVGAMTCAITVLGVAASVMAWDEFIVITTDFSTHGSIASLQRWSPWTVMPDREPVGSDPVARYHDGLYYVVNRGGDSSIQVIDPLDGYQTVRQFALQVDDDGVNPQDIAFARDGTAYVSCYDVPLLLRIDPSTGAILGSVSTAAFADADGLPETGWMQPLGDLLYVTCQRLDSQNWYVPTDLSVLAIFDMAGAAWVDVVPNTPQTDGIVLTGLNPYCKPELTPSHERLRVGCTGWYGLLDGGVELVDLQTRASLGFEVTEAELGGDLLDFVTTGPERAYAILSDLQFHTSVCAYNPATGAHVDTILPPAGYDHADLAYDGVDQLYLADRRTGAAGLRVFDAPTGAQLTTVPLSTGLPPYFIALPLEESLTDVAAPMQLRLQLRPPWPNPANPGCSVAFTAPPGSAVLVGVFDLRGRRVSIGRAVADASGRGVWRFDGRDLAGRLLASGVYRVVVEARGATVTSSLTIVR